MKNSIIIIPFNAHLDDVCDYAEQTVRLLAKENTVIGVALGNPVSLYRDFFTVWQKKFLISHWGARVLRPVMVVPFQRFEWIKRLNIFLNILAINLWALFQSKPKVLWFFEPRYQKLFLLSLVYRLSIFDCVDYFSAYEDWQGEQIYCLKKSSLVVFISHTLQRKYKTIQPNALVSLLGLSLQDMPSRLIHQQKGSRFTFGFVGSIGYRLDFNFLTRLIKLRPKDKFIFIGPQDFNLTTSQGRKNQQLFKDLVDRNKIEWISKLSREKAWQKAKKFDAGMIPYDSRDPFNKYSFPMKVMEYFYAGLPVISTEIDELTRYKDFVYVPIKQGWRGLNQFLKKASSAKHRQKQRAVALQHTWPKKISLIGRYVDEWTWRQSSQE